MVRWALVTVGVFVASTALSAAGGPTWLRALTAFTIGVVLGAVLHR